MSEVDSESVAFQLEKERARATKAQLTRERHTATVKKMKGMASHRPIYSPADESYSFPSLHDTSTSSAEIFMEQSPGLEAFETSFFQLQQHEVGSERAVDVSLADLDTSFETSLEDVDTSFETIGSQSWDEFEHNTGTNLLNTSHESLLDADTNHQDEFKEGYEKDESIQCVYSTFGKTVGEVFEFCIMGEVVPQKKKSDVDKARKMFFKEKKEMEPYNMPPYSDSQRKAVEEMFGPASSGSRSEKEEVSSLSDGGGGGLKDESEVMLAPKLSNSSSSGDKEEASASGGLKDDSTPRNVSLPPSRSASDEHASTEKSGVIDGSVQNTDSSAPRPQGKAKVKAQWKAQVKPQWKAKEPVSSQISTTSFSDAASPNIRTRRERSKKAKEMQRRKYGHKSPESQLAEERPDALSAVVPKDASPPPVHKRPQFEHFSALSSDEIAKNANKYKVCDKLPFGESSSLTLDVSAIKCTSSDEETEPRSVSISTSPAKSVSKVVANMVPETPRTTNRSFTASQKSGGRWISPRTSTSVKPPLTKAAPQKFHTAVAERNFEPGNARKQLFGVLDHVAAKEAGHPVVPKDASPPPAHKRPQWEHFSALSSDGIASNLTLDVSAIKCTNSDDEVEPRSASISASPVKIVSSVDADMDPETPRTTNRSFTASQKSSGRWISPSASTTFEPPLTKSAPQKSHRAVTERNIEPGAARKQLFGALDQPEETPNASHATDITENYLDAVRISSLSFDSPSRKSRTETTHATPGIFKSQPAHDDTMTTANTTEEDSRTLDFDLSQDWEMFPNAFVEPSVF
jgi:hypothetical protein